MEEKREYKKGLWSVEEDRILMDYITKHGKGKWNRIPKLTGLKRCGKSCRLRWINYLSPAVKRGGFSDQENDLIVRLHNLLGNRWSLIAGRVPGRTDNQVKNHWNTHLSKKMGIKNKQHGASSLPRDPIPRCKNIGDNNNSNISASGGMMMITTGDEFWHNDLNFNLPITPTTTGNVMELLDDDLSLDFLWHGL